MSAVSVNLLPMARFARVRRRALIERWRIAGLLYGVVLLGVWGMFKMSAVQESSDREQLDRLQRDVAALRSTDQQLTRQITTMRKQLDAALAVGHHPDWGVLLALAAAERGPEVLLEHCEIRTLKRAEPARDARARRGAKEAAAEPTVRQFVLEGTALSVRAVQDFVLRLEASELFRQVQLGDAQANASGGPGEAMTRFTITCEMVEARP